MLETQQSQQKYSSFVMIFPVTSGKTSKDSSNRFDGIHFCDDNARIGSHRKPCVDMSDDTYFYLKPNLVTITFFLELKLEAGA